MDFWSKGLGKRTIAIGLTEGESMLSDEALCLKGTMEEPVSWEYVMLLETSDLVDFFALLKEPAIAKYIHASPNRWQLYAGFVVGGAQIAWRATVTALRHRIGAASPAERVPIQLPPPSVIKKRKKKKVAYRRRLSTTTIDAPTMAGGAATSQVAEARGA